MTDDHDDVDLDSVVADIKASVDAKRAAGVYSESLDEEFRSVYARMLERPDPAARSAEVREALSRLDRVGGFAASRIDTTSGLRGGELVHRAVGKIVSRQILGLVEQLNSFTGALMPVLHALGDAVTDDDARRHADFLHELDTLQDRCAALERSLGRVLGTLDGDGDPVAPAVRAVDEVATRAEPPTDLAAPVIDLAMVDDPRRALGRAAPEGAGTVLLLTGAEELRPAELIDVVALAHRALRDGGRLYVEAFNPQSLVVHARALWRGAGVVTPLDADYAEAVLRAAGFTVVERAWLPAGSSGALVESSGDESPLAVAFNENVRRLNQLLYAPPRYRLIATR